MMVIQVVFFCVDGVHGRGWCIRLWLRVRFAIMPDAANTQAISPALEAMMAIIISLIISSVYCFCANPFLFF